MMKYKCRVNHGIWFTPKVEFMSEWAAWLYIKSAFGDAEINDCRMVPLTQVYDKYIDELKLHNKVEKL